MLIEAIRIALGLVLAGAALSKLASPAPSRDALVTFGFDSPTSRALAWALLVAAELGLAAGVIAGSAGAAMLAAGLVVVMALTLVSAILRGAAGAPCGCFGPHSKVGWGAVLRNLALGVGFAVVALV